MCHNFHIFSTTFIFPIEIPFETKLFFPVHVFLCNPMFTPNNDQRIENQEMGERALVYSEKNTKS